MSYKNLRLPEKNSRNCCLRQEMQLHLYLHAIFIQTSFVHTSLAMKSLEIIFPVQKKRETGQPFFPVSEW